MPLVLLRGRYAVGNLRNLPALVEAGGRPNRTAIRDRLVFFSKGFGLGVLGGFAGGSLGVMYGKSRARSILADAGSLEHVKEYQMRVIKDMKAEAEHRRGYLGPGPRKPDDGFVPQDEDDSGPKTVDDSSFEANSASPFTSAPPPPTKPPPSRWEAIRQDRSAKPSTWDRIRQERARSASGAPPAQDRERTESSTYDPRPNLDKEQERKEFEEMLERERRMGEDGAQRGAKEERWS